MKTLSSLLLLSSLLHTIRSAAIGLSDVHATQPTVEEGEHLKPFWDGFLLDNEETMDRNNNPSTEDQKSGEKNGFKDFIPMIDPEADSDMIVKFGDFSLLRNQIKQRQSTKLHQRSKRLIYNEIERWENGIIPYFIWEEYFTPLQVNLILRGMAHWENYSCIRFKNRTNERTYLEIYPGGSCSTFVGKGYGGPQGLSLAPACFHKPQTVIHELGHAIGFCHEHSRPDRNEYIHVNYSNIRDRVDPGQFDIIQNTSYYTVNTLGLPYDYNSIMHYDGDQFAKDPSNPTIKALDPNIIVGKAVELSPLDIIRVNKYYQCQEPFSAKITHWVPLDLPEDKIPPRPHSCGALIMGEHNGSVSSPDYPQFTPNISCSWQIIVPEGYRVKINIESFGLKTGYLTRCQDNNITFLQLDYTERIISRICKYNLYRDRPYYTTHNEAHIEYRSGLKSSNDPSKGFSMNFTSVDINECEENADCSHKCINTPGSYICTCKKGYFLSADGHNCFDINECAVDGSLCEYKCRNLGGHYKCICPDGSDQIGPTCTENVKVTTSKAQNTKNRRYRSYDIGVVQVGWPLKSELDHSMGPDISGQPPTTASIVSSPDQSTNPLPPPSTKPSTTSASTEQPTTTPISTEQPTTTPITSKQPITTPIFTEQPTTKPSPTDAPTTVMPTPVMVVTQLTQLQGEFSSPNWPNSYPQSVDYQWQITCPSDRLVDINFEQTSFEITGQMPDCNLDWVQIHKGGSEGDVLGKFCGSTSPPQVKSDSNITVIKFHAGIAPSSSNRGFRASYKCVYKCPPPIETPSLPPCGGYIRANNGTITSPNFPITYNVNEICEWIIELPDCQKVVEIKFANFSVAGRMPKCPKDQLYIHDGIVSESHTHGPLCHLSLPSAITTSSNLARIRFVAGPKHGPRRIGFSLTFKAINRSS